jgi:hypothetical protein
VNRAPPTRSPTRFGSRNATAVTAGAPGSALESTSRPSDSRHSLTAPSAPPAAQTAPLLAMHSSGAVVCLLGGGGSWWKLVVRWCDRAAATARAPPPHTQRPRPPSRTRVAPQEVYVRPGALRPRQLRVQQPPAAAPQRHHVAGAALHKVERGPSLVDGPLWRRRGSFCSTCACMRRRMRRRLMQLEPRESRNGAGLGAEVRVVQHAAGVGVGGVGAAAGVEAAGDARGG